MVNRPFAQWRHFTTSTRILFVFPFTFKFGNPSANLHKKAKTRRILVVVVKWGCFLVLRKLLLVRFCVVVWVLFSVFSIFCITSLVSATPRNHLKWCHHANGLFPPMINFILFPEALPCEQRPFDIGRSKGHGSWGRKPRSSVQIAVSILRSRTLLLFELVLVNLSRYCQWRVR